MRAVHQADKCLLCAFLFTPVFGVNELFGSLFEIGFAGGQGTAGGMASVFTDTFNWADGADLGKTTATIGLLAGIFGGIFTATEAAAVAVVYALIVSLFVYKDTKWSELPSSFVEASVSTATIMVMVGLSKASSYVVVTSGLPALLLDTFSSLTESRVLILLLLNLLFLIIGMLMEANAAIIMMTPILTPLLTAFNIDALQFGIVMSFNLCIGLVTPPVGLCLLLSNQIGETSLSKSLKALMPLLLISIVVLLLITYVDPLTTWLPSLLKK